MARTSKFRRRPSISDDLDVNDDESTYLYPRHKLYTKKENELLDSIYSTEGQTDADVINDEIEFADEEADSEAEDFWNHSNKEFLTPENQKIKYLGRAGWFLCGAAFASLIWMIFFQVNVSLIKSKADTKIVFQNSPDIVTDKDVDKKVTKDKSRVAKVERDFNEKVPFFSKWFNAKQPEPVAEEVGVEDIDLEKETDKDVIEERVEIALSQPATIEVPKAVVQKRSLPKNPEMIKATTTVVKETVKPEPVIHVIKNGDSLWTIAQKYYGNPSPSNIRKIREANNLRSTFMKLGQKLVIPLD